MDGPVRASRVDAEKDREFVAAAMSLHPRSSRMEAASGAIKHLRNGGAPTLPDGPGSASTIHGIDADKLASMSKLQLRSLATQTPGIVRNKKNAKGKWIPKTCKELRAELLVLKAAKSTQALPGQATRKRPASFVQNNLVMKKPCLKQRQSLTASMGNRGIDASL